MALGKSSRKIICTSVARLSARATRSRRSPAVGTVATVPSPGCFLQNAPGEAKKSDTCPSLCCVETRDHVVNRLGSVCWEGREETPVLNSGRSAGILGALEQTSLRPPCRGHPQTSATEEEKLVWSWREACSAGGEDEAEEERDRCCGRKRFWVLLAPLTLRREGLGPSQCRCEHSSHHLENWALEAGAASCPAMGSAAFQVRAVPRVPTLLPFPAVCSAPHRCPLPPTLCSFPCNLL